MRSVEDQLKRSRKCHFFQAKSSWFKLIQAGRQDIHVLSMSWFYRKSWWKSWWRAFRLWRLCHGMHNGNAQGPKELCHASIRSTSFRAVLGPWHSAPGRTWVNMRQGIHLYHHVYIIYTMYRISRHLQQCCISLLYNTCTDACVELNKHHPDQQVGSRHAHAAFCSKEETHPRPLLALSWKHLSLLQRFTKIYKAFHVNSI